MAFIVPLLVSCSLDSPKLGKVSVDKVVAAMTLEEKANIVIGSGMEGFTGDEAVIGTTLSLVPGAAGTTYAIPRLGIPAIALADGPAGLRINPTREGDCDTYYCTHFPIGTLLASTWNQELVEKVGAAIGNEALEYGVDILLAPALNIRRHPLCGRNFEYYSEDPFLSGKMAAAVVRGVQEEGTCGAVIKHFACNNQEDNRMGVDVHISERALREIYLRGFEIAVKESAPVAIMTSYNRVNGVHAANSRALCTVIAREEWGFDGVLMSDWSTTAPEDGSIPWKCIEAGNDLIMPGSEKDDADIRQAYADGRLSEKKIRLCAGRIISLINKLDKKITKVVIGNNIVSIGKNAFAKCTKLVSVIIGKNVTKIGKDAFAGCKKLKKIVIKTKKLTKKSVAKGAFRSVGKKVVVQVPKSEYKAYKKLLRAKGLSKKVKIKRY